MSTIATRPAISAMLVIAPGTVAMEGSGRTATDARDVIGARSLGNRFGRHQHVDGLHVLHRAPVGVRGVAENEKSANGGEQQ